VAVWSNKRLLGTSEELREYTREARTVWVARLRIPERRGFGVEDVWADRLVEVSKALVSVDGRIEVIQVTLG